MGTHIFDKKIKKLIKIERTETPRNVKVEGQSEVASHTFVTISSLSDRVINGPEAGHSYDLVCDSIAPCTS